MFVPVADILNIPCDYQFVFSDELLFHTTLHAAGNIPRMHYASTKCDVSLSQGSVNTLGLFSGRSRAVHAYVKKILPAYISVKIIYIEQYFPAS